MQVPVLQSHLNGNGPNVSIQMTPPSYSQGRAINSSPFGIVLVPFSRCTDQTGFCWMFVAAGPLAGLVNVLLRTLLMVLQ